MRPVILQSDDMIIDNSLNCFKTNHELTKQTKADSHENVVRNETHNWSTRGLQVKWLISLKGYIQDRAPLCFLQVMHIEYLITSLNGRLRVIHGSFSNLLLLIID